MAQMRSQWYLLSMAILLGMIGFQTILLRSLSEKVKVLTTEIPVDEGVYNAKRKSKCEYKISMTIENVIEYIRSIKMIFISNQHLYIVKQSEPVFPKSM